MPREQDDARGRGERVALLAGEQLSAQDEDAPGRMLRGDAGRAAPGANERLERRAELRRVRRRLLVDDDEVDREALHPPVLVGAQELPHDALVLDLVDPHEHDRQSPEIPWLQRAEGPLRLRRSVSTGRAQGGVGVQDPRREPLEEVRLVGW